MICIYSGKHCLLSAPFKEKINFVGKNRGKKKRCLIKHLPSSVFFCFNFQLPKYVSQVLKILNFFSYIHLVYFKEHGRAKIKKYIQFINSPEMRKRKRK